MPMRLRLRSPADILSARKAVQKLLEDLGLKPVRVTRFTTAVSEIARNTVAHGGGGDMTLQFENSEGRRWLAARFTDRGAGIPDIAAAMSDGYSTAKSLGLGLGGAKRLSDAFEIASDPENGTTVKLACRLN